MTEIFNWIILCMNVVNMVVMTYQPCYTAGQHHEDAHQKKIKGEGPSYIYIPRGRVTWLECAANLESGSLSEHHQNQHICGRGPQWAYTPPPADPHMCQVLFPQMAVFLACQFEVCRGKWQRVSPTSWKTLPNLKFSNLNFKLKVQTQTWTSKN